MEQLELLKHTDKINELLARYGVKFGIYKNNVFNLIPFQGLLNMRNSAIWKKG